VTISAAAQQTPIVPAQSSLPFVVITMPAGQIMNGFLSQTGRLVLQQAHDFVANMARIIPANATTVSNVITLTLLPVQPAVTQYAIFDTYAFVADVTSTGLLSAFVVTSSGTLITLKIFKNNGAAQATTGDVTIGLQYFLTFVDSLDTGGGFVLR
jgi:hypothetical protein